MLTELFARYKTLLTLLGVIAVIGLVAWLVFSLFLSFTVTSTTPSLRAVSYQQPQIVVNFNKAIDESSLSIESESLKVAPEVVGPSIRFNIFSELDPDNEYTILIKEVRSKDGMSLKNYSLQFTPELNDSSLTDRDNALILARQNANKDPILSDRILDITPYSTLQYNIRSYIDTDRSGESHITLEIEILLSAADVRINRQAAIDAAKQQALAYLAGLEGVNINDYTLIYTLREPSLY